MTLTCGIDSSKKNHNNNTTKKKKRIMSILKQIIVRLRIDLCCIDDDGRTVLSILIVKMSSCCINDTTSKNKKYNKKKKKTHDELLINILSFILSYNNDDDDDVDGIGRKDCDNLPSAVAAKREASGRLPLNIACEHSLPWDKGLGRIVQSYMPALDSHDPITRLLPFAHFAVGEMCDLDTIYELLRHHPDSIKK